MQAIRLHRAQFSSTPWKFLRALGISLSCRGLSPPIAFLHNVNTNFSRREAIRDDVAECRSSVPYHNRKAWPSH